MTHDYHMRLNGIELRPFMEDDSEKYRILRNSDENRRWFFNNALISVDAQRRWYNAYIQNPREAMFSIYLNGMFIGANALYDIDRADGKAEYGRLIVDRSYVGYGYGRLATQAAMHIAKAQMGLRTVVLHVMPKNIPAIRTYERAGFRAVREVGEDSPDVLAMYMTL